MNTLASSNVGTKAPLWLKIVAGIGVIWYGYGLLQCWMGFTMDTAAAVGSGAMTAAHAAAIEGTLLLIWIAFALASGAGLFGAVMLFGRSSSAKTAFAISLLSAIVYYLWVYGLSGTGADRPSEETIISVVVVAVTLAFLLLSIRMTKSS